MVTAKAMEMAMELKQQTVPAKAMEGRISIAKVMENLTATAMAILRQTPSLPARTSPEEAIDSATVVVFLDPSIVA